MQYTVCDISLNECECSVCFNLASEKFWHVFNFLFFCPELCQPDHWLTYELDVTPWGESAICITLIKPEEGKHVVEMNRGLLSSK